MRAVLFWSGTHRVFWVLADIMERLLWKVVSSNQSEFPDEHGVAIVCPNSHLENKRSRQSCPAGRCKPSATDKRNSILSETFEMLRINKTM